MNNKSGLVKYVVTKNLELVVGLLIFANYKIASKNVILKYGKRKCIPFQ